jgi:predicted dehydrogenase
LQDWISDPNAPISWRLKKELAGSGTHGDINAHIIDLARFLVGEFASVCATMETFVKERPVPAGAGTGISRGKASKKMEPVTVDDYVAALARFENGALGTFEASRFATGCKNANGFEIFGEKGSVAFDFERMNELKFFDATSPKHLQGWTRILATEPEHPYAGHYWPPGHLIGYEHGFISGLAEALRVIGTGKGTLTPNFKDGLANQKVLAAMSKSAERGRWVKV